MPGFRVIRAALEADGKAWAAALTEGAWRPRAKLLKQDGRTTVLRARLLEREVVIKIWHMGAKARLQALIGGTRGLRHWQGAARLRQCGVPTAWTWALLRGVHEGRRAELLVMEAIQGKTVLRHLADKDLSVRDEHALAAAVGRQVAVMTHNAMCNRDHKPSNLVAMRDAAGKAAVAVIDCVAIARPGCADRMLASLVIEPLGVGLQPRRTLMMRVLRSWIDSHPTERNRGRRSRRFLWDRVAGIVKAHGDPTPRVDPLA